MGADVISLGTPGWCPTKDNILKAADSIETLKVGHQDIVVLDLWSNSAFLGTDESGFPLKPVKSNSDGKYHIMGELQHAPKQVFQRILSDAAPLFSAGNGARIVLLAPFPRYRSGKCCQLPGHVSNYGTDGFDEIFVEIHDIASSMFSSVAPTGEVTLVGFDDMMASSVLSEANGGGGSGGGRLWDSDNVHLLPNVYDGIGRYLFGLLEDDSHLPSRKRPRLDSVVPVAARSTDRPAGQVKLPAWLSGNSGAATRGHGGRGGRRGRYTRFIRYTGGRGRGGYAGNGSRPYGGR
jgi:hypothetical protein